MLTCYPGSSEEILDAEGQVWSGPCTAAKGYLRHLDNEREKGGLQCQNHLKLIDIK